MTKSRTNVSAKFRFVDLFSGIGGFHLAMTALGGECVLASEIDERARNVYERNFGIEPKGDVRKISADEIPDFDVLCAGFPCQAFSKAGKQMGFVDPSRGTLFFEIKRFLVEKRPKFFVLENVRNLLSHDSGNTWKVISEELTDAGYDFEAVVFSPIQVGTPQLRERAYVLGVRRDLGTMLPKIDAPKRTPTDMSKILERNADEKYEIDDSERRILTCWNEFRAGIGERPLGFPVWSAEFGSNEPLDDDPKWKAEIRRKNRELYEENAEFIDGWLERWNRLSDFTPTNRKFEWQAGASADSIWECLIQFRPSGVRAKRADAFPALVASVQIPIIGTLGRRLTPREAARLQDFPDDFEIDENDFFAYKQFGNAVNAKCVEFLAERLFGDAFETENFT